MKKSLVFAGAWLACWVAVCASAAPAAPVSPLHVDGKWVRNMEGKAVTLRGVALADLDAIAHGDRSQARPTTVEDIMDLGSSAGWNVDVFRLTVHPEVTDETGRHGWLHYQPAEYVSRILDPAIRHAAALGEYVIVDWHYVGAEWRNPEVAANTSAFWLGSGSWQGIASLYANDPNVLFELFNEPGPGTWADWKVSAQAWVDGIRARGASNIVIVGGPQWSQVMPRGDADLLAGPNIVYACHIYPFHALRGMPNWIDWVSGRAPVIMTEWGYVKDGPVPVDGTTSGYGRLYRSFIDARPNVGWIAWCFDSVYYPPMFDLGWVLLGNGRSTAASRFHAQPDDTAENYMGQFVKTWLSEAAANRP
jgi:hypothetical protein